jgi:hypothetical protein
MRNRIWIKGVDVGIIIILMSTWCNASIGATNNIEKSRNDETLLKVERIYGTAGVINVELKNIGSVDAIEVIWILGYGQLHFIPPVLTYTDTDGYIPRIAVNESVIVKTTQGSNPTLLLGLIPLIINFKAYGYNAPLVSNSTRGFLLLIFVKI